MVWHYKCPNCGAPMAVDWERHKLETVCPKCRTRHYPPTPDEDPYAFIVGPEWPPEMERVVVARRGSVCAVPGCFSSYNTLTFRKPLSRGGTISVDNLIPVCTKHDVEKGERDYDEWVRELEEKRLAEAGELVLPPVETGLPIIGFPETERIVRYVQTIASGYEVKLTPLADNSPVIVAPFLRGAVRRVVFDYRWEAQGRGNFRVFLVAWSKGEKPEFKLLGTEGFKGLSVQKEHSVTEESQQGDDWLTLTLPSDPLGRWVAAVVLTGEVNLMIKEFVLAATD